MSTEKLIWIMRSLRICTSIEKNTRILYLSDRWSLVHAVSATLCVMEVAVIAAKAKPFFIYDALGHKSMSAWSSESMLGING